MANDDWVPTARLRWVARTVETTDSLDQSPLRYTKHRLQQWYSQDVPGYMRKSAEGEWRDVSVEEEIAP